MSDQLISNPSVPALTLFEFEPGGEWAVTLSDYHGNRDIATIAMFDTRAEAEALIGRIRHAR
jgi:urease beta subunit